ncbi:hypothetical protein C8F04DRAFT_1189301 [Mycena alexandri]|uniref:Uncharacterized protein n=1 Tax=Mycena alexandri TaxID=1745969 RepID=A0AAD6X0G3_9AGAR|nr:hypothetical protein C8F04DRAFT_1189301 [Mycena alexandri]
MTQLPHCEQGPYSAPLPHITPGVFTSLSSPTDVHIPTFTSTPTPTPTQAPTPTPAAPMTATTSPTPSQTQTHHVQPMAIFTVSAGCCPMPYYPDPGVDIDTHSQDARKYFYVVKEGRIKGTFTNDVAATSQTRHFSNGRMRACTTFEGACNEWEQNCRDFHGAVCPDASNGGGYFQGPMPPAPTPSPTPSDGSVVSFDSTDSFTSSQLSDVLSLGNEASAGHTSGAPSLSQTAGAPAAVSSRPPITASTRIALMTEESRRLDEGKYWGVPGVLSTFTTRTNAICSRDAVHAARIQGIRRPNVWGHHDKKVVDDFIMSTSVEADLE